MATTTPNFGWPVPTSTDLVKDGATAIEALGDSIDASLLDLKGGTTGQVLSKNSNTDMDFTWVTDAAGDITGVTAGTGISGGGTSGTVTVTNSMATAIDAKGDLVAGTAADTFARLAVGTNGQVLTADSTAATGLAWSTSSAGGTWTNFTPTYTDITVGNGTVVARYSKNANLVTVYFRFTLGSTSSTGAFPVVTLPSPIVPVYKFTMIGQYLDAGVQSYVAVMTTDGANVNCDAIGTGSTYAVGGQGRPFTLGTNDVIQFSGTYEVA
jgi:hypothetical protein